MKKAPVQPSGESTQSSIKRALQEAGQDRLRTNAWLQRQKDKATRVGGSIRRTKSSSASLEEEREYIVIEEVNPPFEMRRVALPSEESSRRPAQLAIPPSSLALIPLASEGSLV